MPTHRWGDYTPSGHLGRILDDKTPQLGGMLDGNGFTFNGAVAFEAKAGEALSKGNAVYVSGVSGNKPVVMKADADDAAKMPAFGIAATDASLNANVNIVTFGTVYEIDTSAYSVGDELYISTTAGALTATKPSGATTKLQNIGKVIRSHASAGSIKVGGAGRTNAVPNLDNGTVFIGNAGNQAEQRALVEADISDFGTYLTAEADTLDSVTDRGATTTNAVTVGNLTSTGIDVTGTVSADEFNTPNHQATNLAVGWYTIGYLASGRAGARFAVWDTGSGRHQYCVLYASHMYGTNASNTINILTYAVYSGSPIQKFRLKENGTYDGAALQVYIDDATNNVRASIVGDNVQSPGWTLADWVDDATNPGVNGTWSSFVGQAEIDLADVGQGGISATGNVLAGGDVVATGSIAVGDGSSTASHIAIKAADDTTADELQFYNGTTRMGEIGTQDTTWLRINQETGTNIYTPRYIRADGGFFVDGTAKGINGSGNFIGGTVTTPSLTTETASGAAIFIKDTSGTGATNHNSWLSFRDSGGTEIGYVGYGSSSDTKLYMSNYSNGIVQLSGVYVDGGSDFRAGIMYDNDNTSYYVDPASTSRLNISYNNETSHLSESGRGVKFWNSDDYKIYMSAISDGTWGGDVANSNASDYAMYFRMSNGTNRGFIFRNDTTNVAKIDGAGVFSGSGVHSTGQYLDLKYNEAGGGGVRLYDSDSTLQGYWYGNGSGEHGLLDNDGAWAVRVRTGTNQLRLQTDNNNECMIYTSYVRAVGSCRSPIFYDFNNTGYYAHLDSTEDSIRAAGDIVAYYSDERLKDIEGPIENALDKVATLDGFYYRGNKKAQKLGYDDKLKVGLSAQQVKAVLPEVIKSCPADNQYMTLDYSKVVPLLVEAIKELKAEIEELKK
jgi:hypothetical protein